MAQAPSIFTFGELKKSGYRNRSIKEELRTNLIAHLSQGTPMFEGIQGYEDSVIPEIQNAILAKHNILLLGLRGQAKTKIARQLVQLLDEYIPAIEGTELAEDPFLPITAQAKEILKTQGDATPIRWIHRSARYSEKLATPDVSVADLIGDLDPIKAASQKLSYADERAIHYGMIPRAHRGLFVINELPDLQARIQVSLFNILQEGDIQIRGFKLRLPLDLLFVFTANPEDYTNRGSIITPLKDRIESQIITHYPTSIELSKAITEQEAELSETQKSQIRCVDLVKTLLEQITFEARKSEYVDQKSGVSARLSISAMETLFSNAERRMLLNKENNTGIRISDVYAVVPAITGKIELVYEGENEGMANVAQFLIGKAIRHEFEKYFPNPEKKKKNKDKTQEPSPYGSIIAWFNDGNLLELRNDLSETTYKAKLDLVPGLKALVEDRFPSYRETDKYLLMEFLLHGLAEFSQLARNQSLGKTEFKDLFGSLFNNPGSNEEFE
ncbi:MAG: sigma 54-interacting transcriptional regulator [Cytophagaceae bacterium]|jgi:magnesium chelatase subunit I|nr:sigma 54-interacting transcriptional regulator [Cytophagaceae bacterium]